MDNFIRNTTTKLQMKFFYKWIMRYNDLKIKERHVQAVTGLETVDNVSLTQKVFKRLKIENATNLITNRLVHFPLFITVLCHIRNQLHYCQKISFLLPQPNSQFLERQKWSKWAIHQCWSPQLKMFQDQFPCTDRDCPSFEVSEAR